MLKLSRNETGFSAIETVLVLVIVVLIGSVGWLVHKDYHKVATAPAYKATTTTTTKSTTNSSKTTQAVNAYAGWGSICSSTGGLCLEYPSSWKLAHTIGSSPAGSDLYSITSPSGNTTVWYIIGIKQSGIAVTEQTYASSVASTAASGLDAVSVLNTVPSEQPEYQAEDFVIPNTGSGAYKQGATQSNQAADNSYNTGFTNPKQTGSNASIQYIYVDQGADASNTNYFNTYNEAQAWLSSSEVQTANKILASVSYSN